jgi:hypothetical protein
MANTHTNKPIHTIHFRCPCELKQVGPHVGLYCKTHKEWIKWLDRDEIKAAIDLGVKLATTPNRDKLTLKDNHTLNKRIKKQKRWHKYKANKGTK